MNIFLESAFMKVMQQFSPSNHEVFNLTSLNRLVSEEFNLLKYFQQQRLEHTRLLRKEIKRLENLENVYLAALRKVKLRV